jgi:hypothetical protein
MSLLEDIRPSKKKRSRDMKGLWNKTNPLSK